MKYRIIKDIPYYKIGEVITVNGMNINNEDGSPSILHSFIINDSFNDLIGKYFEEIKEKVKDIPKFKIGDYVVVIPDKDSVILSPIQFMKIADIEIRHKGINNFKYLYNRFDGEELRKPTEEELSLYFR